MYSIKELFESLREKLFLYFIFKKYIKNNQRIDYILKLKIDNRLKDLIGERNLISEENGWRKKMLLRYAIAMHYSRDKSVLETCSGLGWGAYLLDSVANKVTCIEINKDALELSRQLWNSNKTEYINGSVLEIPFEDNTYDIVTAMESIEHFKLV